MASQSPQTQHENALLKNYMLKGVKPKKIVQKKPRPGRDPTDTTFVFYEPGDKTAAELAEENRALKAEITCKICKDKQATKLAMPCGHLGTCDLCCPYMLHTRECPRCKRKVKGVVNIYM